MQPNSWNQLSVSSRRTLQWAGALARYRAEQTGKDPASSEADAFDLLVGMLLEHPLDAEPKLLLEHFHLVPGQVLPADYMRPSPEAIERHMRAISAGKAARTGSRVRPDGVKVRVCKRCGADID